MTEHCDVSEDGFKLKMSYCINKWYSIDSNMKGNFNPSPDFDYKEGALTQNGCDMTYMGEFLYFGDNDRVSFISMLW